MVDSDFQVSQLLSPSHSILQVWSLSKKCKEEGLCGFLFLLISVDYELHDLEIKVSIFRNAGSRSTITDL